MNAKYSIEVENERKELREILKEYDVGTMPREELTEQLGFIREKYASIKENLLDENAKILFESDKKHMDSIQRTIDRINNNEDVSPFIKAIWNSETHSIELVRK